MGTSQFEIPRSRDSFLFNSAGDPIASSAMGRSEHRRGLGNQRDRPKSLFSERLGSRAGGCELLPTNATGLAEEQQAGIPVSLDVHPANNVRSKCQGALEERVKRQLPAALWENASSDFSSGSEIGWWHDAHQTYFCVQTSGEMELVVKLSALIAFRGISPIVSHSITAKSQLTQAPRLSTWQRGRGRSLPALPDGHAVTL